MGNVPKIFVFDRSGILDTNIHFWKAIAQSGQCLVPQLVLDEVKQVADQASIYSARYENPGLQFLQYLPKSSWRVTDLIKVHPSLVAGGQGLSRGARTSLLVGHYAYGVAMASPDHLTILVSNDQKLIRCINQLQLDHLCGITVIAAREWAFGHTLPSGLAMAEANFKLGQKLIKHGFRSIGYRDRLNWWRLIPRIITNILGVGGILVLGIAAILIIWQQIQPQEFEKFWQHYDLPSLPKSR